MPTGVQVSQFTDPVLRGSISDTFNAWNADKMSKEIYKDCGFKQMETSKAFEEFTEFAGLGLAPRQNEFQNAATDIVKQGVEVRINQYIYGINMPVGQLALKSKEVKGAIQSTKAVAESLYNSREILHADVFANAFTATLPDGQAVIGAAGLLPRGGTMDNLLAGASFADTSVEAGCIKADKMPGGHGIPVGVEVKAVLIPPEYRFDAVRIFKSTNQPGLLNNNTNAVRMELGDVKIVRNRFFASASNWFLLTDADLGLITVWMQKPDIEEVGMSHQKAVIFYGSQILGIGVVNRRSLIGSNI